jgi:hypothetical protein
MVPTAKIKVIWILSGANRCRILSFVDICIVVGEDPIIKRGRVKIPLTV